MSSRFGQWIAVVLAVAWLPHASIRCVENPATHSGCPMMAAPSPSEQGDHHGHGGASQMAHEHGSRHSEKPTCCKVTGKCHLLLTSETNPAPSLAVLPESPLSLLVAFEGRRAATAHASIDGRHDPPRYLRFASFLI